MLGALLHIKDCQNVTVRGPGTLYGNAERYISGYSAIDDRFEPSSPDGSRPRVILFQNASDIRLLDGLQVRCHCCIAHAVRDAVVGGVGPQRV